MSTPVASVLSRAADAVGAFLPRLGGALALLIIGLLLTRLLTRLLIKALQAAGVDRLADRWRIHDVLDSAGLGRSLARVIGIAVRTAVASYSRRCRCWGCNFSASPSTRVFWRCPS